MGNRVGRLKVIGVVFLIPLTGCVAQSPEEIKIISVAAEKCPKFFGKPQSEYRAARDSDGLWRIWEPRLNGAVWLQLEANELPPDDCSFIVVSH
jgi:hypothetical protein